VNDDKEKRKKVFDSCPHCGQKLSPWQQVLLSVDRALTCKNCWYRIILEPPGNADDQLKKPNSDKKFED
jgi:DNA-directed RNA polymerase subunit RPC12/RpoP